MTLPPIGLLTLVFCLLEPCLVFFVRHLQDQIPLDPLLLGYLPSFMAVVATAILLLMHRTVLTVCRKDSLSPKQKSPFRSEP
jgi:hypothetical protein